MIKEIRISGFRGFGSSQTIPFAIPDAQKSGSGLTIITGANNAGKTTVHLFLKDAEIKKLVES